MPLEILRELFEILDRDQGISKTPWDFLENFKNKDSHDQSLTRFGYLLCNLAGKDEDVQAIKKHILWVVFHFGYPRNPFPDDLCRNWLPVQERYLELVNRLHSEVVPAAIDKEKYLSPSMITQALSVKDNLSKPNVRNLLNRSWLIYSTKKGIHPDCFNSKANACTAIRNLPIACFYHCDDEIKVRSCGNAQRNIEPIDTTLEDLLKDCGEVNVSRRFRNFENMLFKKNSFNKLNTSKHLVCSHYFRFPIYRHLNMHAEAYIAISAKNQDATLQAIQPSYLGIRLTSSLVNDKVAYYFRDDNIIKMFVKDLLDIHFNNPTIPPGHPQNIDDIPLDSFLPSELRKLASDGKIDRASIIESFKALYCFDINKNVHRYSIRVDILQHIFKLAKIEFSIDQNIDISNAIALPVRPGMVFIINLIYFLNCMEINALNLNYRDNKVVIIVKLEDAIRFQSGIYTGGSQGVQAFRDLLKCDKEKLVNEGSTERRQEIEKWDPQPLPSFASHVSQIFKPVVEHQIKEDSNELELAWKSNLFHRIAAKNEMLGDITHDIDKLLGDKSLSLREWKSKCNKQFHRLKSYAVRHRARRNDLQKIDSIISKIKKLRTNDFSLINKDFAQLLDVIK